MRIFLSSILLGLVSLVISAGVPPELTGDEALKKIRESHVKVMIMFYAPWCPHCQEAKPKYNDAFTKITDKTSTMAYVNCDDAKNTALCNTEKIEGFPTIKVYQKGKDAATYEGDFTAEAFLAFLKDPVAAPPAPTQAPTPDTPIAGVTMLNTAEDFKKELKATPHAIVFFYAPWCPHCQEAKPKYANAAKDLEKSGAKDKRLFAVNCDLPNLQAFCTAEKVEGFPTLRYYHKGEMFQEFEEEIDGPNILKLLANPPKEKVPPTPVEDDKSGAPAPGARPGEKQLSEDDRKPEKPEDLMKGITYLTGPTANEVLKAHPHSLVKFYAPWCPHCIEAKPLYMAANEELKKNKVNAHLAAINCDAKENEKWCEDLKIEGFPTLAYFRNGKKVKLYEESPPTQAGIVKFMTTVQNSKEEL